MSIRDEFGYAPTINVMRPAWRDAQGVEHGRELRKCPNVVKVIGMFWRDTGQGSWFLPGEDPLWEELDLAGATQPPAEQDPVALRNAKIEAFGREQLLWEANVRSTEWGKNPLWWLNVSVLQPGTVWYDHGLKRLRFPFTELLAEFGTTSIGDYATSQGLPPPRLEL